jgi:hypothetical protein
MTHAPEETGVEITITVDAAFIPVMDAARGKVPRGQWLEENCFRKRVERGTATEEGRWIEWEAKHPELVVKTRLKISRSAKQTLRDIESERALDAWKYEKDEQKKARRQQKKREAKEHA